MLIGVAGFAIDERLVGPIRELAEAYRALLDAADAPGRMSKIEV